MDGYNLIFRHEDGQKVASPEQIQAWMKQTMDWTGLAALRRRTNLVAATAFHLQTAA